MINEQNQICILLHFLENLSIVETVNLDWFERVYRKLNLDALLTKESREERTLLSLSIIQWLEFNQDDYSL